MQKYVYLFSEGNKDMKNILGGKGANLCEMTSLNLPVPKGFIVSTEACTSYYKNHEKLEENIKEEILNAIKKLEKLTKKDFGNPKNPLLVSVRSGARVSMPGMMDTILNLGLNDEVACIYSSVCKNPRFVYDSYRRLISMYADVVKGYPKKAFEDFLDNFKKKNRFESDMEILEDDMMVVTENYKKIYKELAGEEFPQDPKVQLIEAVTAVFRSWNTQRAIYYRKLNDIPEEWGTAVNVQEMVYGNKGENCGTGVAFSRNPATGEKELFGEYLMNAQGEDVVAGIRTPNPISKLKEEMPKIYEEFKKYTKILEDHYKDMQDMEFTIENKHLYLLQTRNGKRTATAAVKIAVDMVKEGKISKEDAILSIEPKELDGLLHKTFSLDAIKNGKVIAQGLAASPGAGRGRIYFNAKDAIKAHENGESVILVRLETSPEDIEGMHHSEGILTIRGGMTSHAAVVARGMGFACVSGCSELIIDEEKKTITTKEGKVYHEKDYISIDGSSGLVYDGLLEQQEPKISGDFKTFMEWVEEVSKMEVRANADTESDAKIAKDFGAKGIGLVRTEHMFFDPQKIFEFRKMILASTKEEREESLNKILPFQKQDFINIYKVMKELPVVIRYLDPPLHEFLPKTKEEKIELSKSLNISLEQIENRISSLKEFNPMMGHRGCRLDVTYPEIAKMQTRAIIEAAIEVKKEGIQVTPEIMIPLITDEQEFLYVKNLVTETAKEVFKEQNEEIPYQIGTMIETPRAAILAKNLAKYSDFFSFGTNDLTQLMYGFSRDDAGKFLNDYYEKKIFLQDPFKQIDEKGVGILMKVAIEESKKRNPKISLGVCGEHGGDPKSIEFCYKLGLSYVSCSPYRVPIARLAVAQASIREKENK